MRYSGLGSKGWLGVLLEGVGWRFFLDALRHDGLRKKFKFLLLAFSLIFGLLIPRTYEFREGRLGISIHSTHAKMEQNSTTSSSRSIITLTHNITYHFVVAFLVFRSLTTMASSLTAYDPRLHSSTVSSPPKLVAFDEVVKTVTKMLSTIEGVDGILGSQLEAFQLSSSSLSSSQCASLPIQTAGQPPFPSLAAGPQAQGKSPRAGLV
jgi:hypothetical protein